MLLKQRNLFCLAFPAGGQGVAVKHMLCREPGVGRFMPPAQRGPNVFISETCEGGLTWPQGLQNMTK